MEVTLIMLFGIAYSVVFIGLLHGVRGVITAIKNRAEEKDYAEK